MTEQNPLEIVLYPHPALRWKSKPILAIDSTVRNAAAGMFELMYTANGIGLAANQVALPWRMFVLNLTGEREQKDEEIVFINPQIVKRRGTTAGEEGCLSFPGLFADVKRSAEVVIEAFDLSGQLIEFELDELAARAVQHELDHLDGVLFVDRMLDSVRREHEGMIRDFETKFRREQSEGRCPTDDVLKQRLTALEPQPPVAKS